MDDVVKKRVWLILATVVISAIGAVTLFFVR